MVAVRNVEFQPDERWPHVGLRGVEPPLPRHLRPVGPRHRRRPTAAVYRRRRLAVAVVAIVVVTLCLWAAAPVLGDPAATPLEGGQVHVVRPGDTYWSIAARLDTDGDTRDTVDALSAANDGRALRVGDRLRLPG